MERKKFNASTYRNRLRAKAKQMNNKELYTFYKGTMELFEFTNEFMNEYYGRSKRLSNIVEVVLILEMEINERIDKHMW